jgi:hypothetical protein
LKIGGRGSLNRHQELFSLHFSLFSFPASSPGWYSRSM